jgi:hypothetical protein
MKIAFVTTVGVCLIVLATPLATAQVGGGGHSGTGSSAEEITLPFVPLYDDREYGMRGVYDHASTDTEGALRGWADYWRGIGELQYRLAVARINNEMAREHYLDNTQKGVRLWYDRRLLRRQALAATAAPRPTPEQIARYAREAAPRPLDDSQYDYTLGTLYWPPQLQNGLFAEQRARIDRLFAERAKRPQHSGQGTANYAGVREATEDMKQMLKSRVHEFTPMEYIAAKQFVSSVEFEAQKRAPSFGPGELLSMH